MSQKRRKPEPPTRLEHMTEPELRDLLNLLSRQIEGTCRHRNVEKSMFVLLLFNDPALAQYACNCERADVIKAMRETADRLEARQDVPRDKKHRLP